MTRYTKLDGRRSLAKKMVDSDSEPESTPAASPSKAEVQPTPTEAVTESPSKEDKKLKKYKSLTESAPVEPKKDAESTEPVASTSAQAANEDDDSKPAAEAADAANTEPPTVEKLLKRAKLLKLKMKKAKNEASKKRFQKMAYDVERQVEQMFGSFEYGPKGQLIRLGAPQTDNMWQARNNGGGWAPPANAARGGDGGWGARGGAQPLNGYGNSNGSRDGGWGARSEEQKRMDRRDERREERAEQRQAKLKCFACRGLGHSAKDCPNALDAQSISLKTDSAAVSDSPMIGRDAVGICFRCGSTEHTLSKCRKPALKGDELPYATCFICHAKGHLSSKCPNNAGRGVYPEGGSCKLCSSVDHLAKDCPLALRNENKRKDREAKALVNQVIVGSTRESGAGGDEDDFHSFARKRAQVDQEGKTDKREAKRAKSSSAKVVSF